MPQDTPRWGFSTLGPGDRIQDRGFKYADADRRLIDRLLEYAAELHHHTGGDVPDLTPTVGPALTLLTTGGAISSGVRYYYRFTIIDALGNETAPSPMHHIDTPRSLAEPAAPALSFITGAGDLKPGSYSYVLSAYKDADTLETKAINSAVVTVVGSSPSNSVALTLPALPAGADGFNIYRKTSTGLHYLWVTAIDNPAPLDVWTDDGSIDPDCDRSLPTANRTSNTNAIEIAFPGATPNLPEGFSWQIYRSPDPRNWSRSRLTELVPAGDPPSTPLVFVDVGAAVTAGAPPTTAQIIKPPEKIDLTDAAEVQGTLPPGLSTTAHVITFAQPGPVIEGAGAFTWVCDFDYVDIIHVRAYLGVESAPSSQDVIIDVNASRPSQGAAAWETIFTNQANRPVVPVGNEIGDPATPDITRLQQGDMLTIDIDQAGGGATPTDQNLTVNIFAYVKHGSETVSFDW